MSKEEMIKELQELMDKSKIERTGFLLMPSILGLNMYEVPEERLKMYMAMEIEHNALTKRDKDNKI